VFLLSCFVFSASAFPSVREWKSQLVRGCRSAGSRPAVQAVRFARLMQRLRNERGKWWGEEFRIATRKACGPSAEETGRPECLGSSSLAPSNAANEIVLPLPLPLYFSSCYWCSLLPSIHLCTLKQDRQMWMLLK